jgi:hypothetical protein
MESLISDRLESRLGELKKEQILFDTIDNLLNALRKHRDRSCIEGNYG